MKHPGYPPTEHHAGGIGSPDPHPLDSNRGCLHRPCAGPPSQPQAPCPVLPVYIVAIAWLYVLMLVSVMQPTVFRGIVTFVGAGLLPLALLLYLVGTPQRRRQRLRTAQREAATVAEPTIGEAPDPAAPAPAAAPVSEDRSR